MDYNKRTFSRFANETAKRALDDLLQANDPSAYQAVMVQLGTYLGDALDGAISDDDKCLLVSTAEDADYLSYGVLSQLKRKHQVSTAVFWNNHYTSAGGSIAPIVHEFIEPGYEQATSLVVVKSVMSGSCVVRTNILALMDKVHAKEIFVLAPVMHSGSEGALRSEFPTEVSSKFKFIYFAKDEERTEDGEVVPGIGGSVYHRLGLSNQPAKTGYMPNLVRQLAGF